MAVTLPQPPLFFITQLDVAEFLNFCHPVFIPSHPTLCLWEISQFPNPLKKQVPGPWKNRFPDPEKTGFRTLKKQVPGPWKNRCGYVVGLPCSPLVALVPEPGGLCQQRLAEVLLCGTAGFPRQPWAAEAGHWWRGQPDFFLPQESTRSADAALGSQLCLGIKWTRREDGWEGVRASTHLWRQ
jgi:hypothetical protein